MEWPRAWLPVMLALWSCRPSAPIGGTTRVSEAGAGGEGDSSSLATIEAGVAVREAWSPCPADPTALEDDPTSFALSATALCLSGEEAFVGTAGGALIAVQKGTGRQRRVACGYRAGVARIQPVHGGLLVSDARDGLWLQPVDGSPRRAFPGLGTSAGFAISGPDVVVALPFGKPDHGPGYEQDRVSLRTVHLAGGAARALADLPHQVAQPVVLDANDAEVFVEQSREGHYGGVELLRVPLTGGKPRAITVADGPVTWGGASAGWYVWYENGQNSPDWGGGQCGIVGWSEKEHKARVLESFGPADYYSQCDWKVWLVLDGAAVVWRSNKIAGLFRRDIPDGQTRQIANPPWEAFGLARDGDEVVWVAPDGTLARASLR